MRIPGRGVYDGKDMQIDRLQAEVDRLQGFCNVLADELAKYNGTTVPGTVRWAEKELEGE